MPSDAADVRYHEGVAKIYAAARDASSVEARGVEPIEIDITDAAQVEAAARTAGDVQVLINNAGISTNTAPVLRVNRGGAVLNVISALSWSTAPTESRHAVRSLTDLVETGLVDPVLDRTFPLEQAPEAMRQLQRGEVRGKIAIVV